jgi:hypothetical protein
MDERTTMTIQRTQVDSLEVTNSILKTVAMVVEADLAYEQATNCGRKFGITGEVGEILVCHALGLKLTKDPRAMGFDALDARANRIQIKTRRGESTDLPKDAGRLSSFSKHDFDYSLMGLLSHNYKLVEVWKADFDVLNPVIQRHEKRNPTIRQFKNVGVRIFPVSRTASG